VPASPPPLDAALVIETAAVRSIFGTSLNARVAPVVLTTIGSGQAEITIRAIAPNGVSSYWHALAAGHEARRQNESALLGLSRIATSAAAKKTITDGDADSRLILAITSLAGSEPVDIVDFGSVATNASSGLPLRYADLAETSAAAHMTSSAYVAAMRDALGRIPSQYRPLRISEVRLRSGMRVLQIDEGAPSPLGFQS
jgi:hypothetical protein